jgi:translation initiation factor IF-2
MEQLEMLREFANDKDKFPEIRSEFKEAEKAKKLRSKKSKEEAAQKAAQPKVEESEQKAEPESSPPPKAEQEKPQPKTEAKPAQKSEPKKESIPEPQAKTQSQVKSATREAIKQKTEPPVKQTQPAKAAQPSHPPQPKADSRPRVQKPAPPQPGRQRQDTQQRPERPPQPQDSRREDKRNDRRDDKRDDRREGRRDTKNRPPAQGKRNETANEPGSGQKEKIGKSKLPLQKEINDKRDNRRDFNRREGKKRDADLDYDSSQLKTNKGKAANQQSRGQYFRFQKGHRQPPQPVEPKKPKAPKVFNLPELIQTSDFINIRELAEKLNLKLKDIEEKMRTIDPQKEYVSAQIMDVSDIKEICEAFGVEVDIVSYEDDIFHNDIEKHKGELTTRAPVVTVMGHVDHGKTTLLDTLRNTRVADREAGGITQTIGAYKLTTNNHDIVFIDTPGHEAFTNIRARGARVTDIVILMVAANDGVKPQTVEAINHALAAKVPIVVAINKIDLDGASPDRVKQELTKHNIIVEDWGGDVVSVEISAKHNKNLDSLLEMLHLVSEMQELKSYKNIPARGTIIESRLDPKLGPLGSVLIQHGQLERGDFFICGNSVGKVKSIFDDKGKVLQKAEVPMPVEIMGFEDVPEAGELFQVTDDIDKARKVIDLRIVREKEANKNDSVLEQKLSLQSLFQRLEDDKTKVFPIIMKTDNYSSSEVLEKILLKHSQDQLKINIVHQGVGNVTESDILLAATSGSIIVGFNVKTPQKLVALAKRENVEVKLYNVIYHLIEDIDKAIKGEIEPEYIENKIGTVEVLQTFKISKIGIIAGCLVKEGRVTKKSKVKVLRKNDLVFEGELETLRRVKNDASEVNAGTECGIKIKNFNAIEIGDILEIYETIVKEVK